MPPPLLVDIKQVDLSEVVLNQEQIYAHLPHRYEFKLLDCVCHLDRAARRMIAYRDVRTDDWWVRGHVPGRPLLPGVLMLEMAAQVAALLARLQGGHEGFIGFGGVDNCKFRDIIVPPGRLYLVVVGTDIRPRRIKCDAQGIMNGKLIFEASITGITMR